MADIWWRRSGRWLVSAVAVVLGAALLAACGGGGGDGSNDDAAATVPDSTTASSVGAASSDHAGSAVQANAQPELFDFNQDGTKEPTCGTADFTGLVVRTYCEDLSGYVSEPEGGGPLVPGSLLSLPGPADDPRDKPITEGASVGVIHLQGADGKEAVVLTLSSDTVFAVGSDKLQEPALASLDNIATGIKSTYPGASIQVRGHTDATGRASDNQSLSERRAAAVAGYFGTKSLDKAKLSSVGLGQTVPNYVEKNPDGSDNAIGRDQNRRIEIVIRPA